MPKKLNKMSNSYRNKHMINIMVSIKIQRQIIEKQIDTEKAAKYMQVHLIHLSKSSEIWDVSLFVKHLCPHPLETSARKMNGTVNNWNFSKSKGHNSVKNLSNVTKVEFDLDIIMINMYPKFH